MIRLPVFPAFQEKNLAITMQASEYFAPYTSVMLKSMIEHASSEYNYDFLVITWDMSAETAAKVCTMADGQANISIRVVDVSNDIETYQKIAQKRADYDRLGAACMIRLMLAELLNNYDVILNVDSDMVACADVAELFQYDLSNYYMGGVPDVLCYVLLRMPTETYFTKDLLSNELKLNSLEEYCNGGLLLLNLDKIRRDFTTEQIMDFAIKDGKFRQYYEQDTFNSLFRDAKLFLPMEWNWLVDTMFLINKHKNQYALNDKVITSYYDAEKNAKIYHYFTSRKPWQNGVCPHADKWWAAAYQTPFFDTAVSRVGKPALAAQHTSTTNDNAYLLFFCETPYQLLNILNIKHHYFYSTKADLILSNTTDVFKYKEKIETLNIFTHVIVSEYDSKADYAKILDIPVDERTRYPERYELALPLQGKYTDYFMPVTQVPYQQMVYYQLVKAGKTPAVHIFEDGSETYTDNLKVNLGRFIKHSLYPEEQRMTSHLKTIFLYRPELYCGTSRLPKLPMMKLSNSDGEFSNILHHVFGAFSLPQEKYLFFDECFSATALPTNHIQILEAVAEIVGRDNIAVKMHPRTIHGEELYRMRGFRIFSDNATPWEMAAFSPQLEDKVLMAVSSNTIWTPFLLAEKNLPSISLARAMKLSRRPHTRVPEYQKFLSKIQAAANREDTRFFMPTTLLELKTIISYLGGEAQ